MMDLSLTFPVRPSWCCVVSLVVSTAAAHAELALDVERHVLPRTAEFREVQVTLTVDDVLPSDYAKKESEKDEWERLHLTLPDSEDADLPLYNAADLTATTGFHRHFWYEAVERKKLRNRSGNLTVTWRFVLKARGTHKLSDLLQGTPPELRLAVSYHRWEGEEYGEALLARVHAFPRLDGVPAEAPQQVRLTPRHHRIHIDWQVPESVEYTNAQGKFSPVGVLAIVAAPLSTPIDMRMAAMVFRPAAEGGDVPLDTGCQLLPDCQLDCGDDDSIYFDFEKIKKISGLEKSQTMRGGTGLIADLKPSEVYRVLLQYYPAGVRRSACLTAQSIENKTLLELNEADTAERGDLRCFIATAAWGTSRAVAELRWWRDNFLLTNSWGRAVTAFYYQHSPPIAALVAEHELLRALVRILLLVPLAFVLLCKYSLLFASCAGLFMSMILLCHRLGRSRWVLHRLQL